jgi:DUF1680 family protein
VTSLALVCAFVLSAGLAFAAPVPDKAPPRFSRPPGIEYQLGGPIGQRLKANLENWELRAPAANPALVRMFYDRDRKPDRNLLPWSGEFIGKHLCAAILNYRLQRDPRQKQSIDRLVAQFLKSQGPDGYLGPFDEARRLTGKNWDVWGHYWAIRALLLYHEEFGAAETLAAATRAADLLVDKFLDKGIPLTNDGSFGQMNYAVIHAFTNLYRVTGKPSYLAMARWIVREWDRPGAGLYLRYALAGKEMFEFPGNRWESLHDFQGMYDLHLLTAGPELRTAFQHIWYSILKGDRHNTGGFTSGEKTTGNPYDPGAIETCCTVAWIDMSVDMLKLTGDSLVADELELSLFNGLIGGQHPSGSWWTYNTPMDGVRKASAHDIVFQARPGSPELNCCSVNAPRGLGLLTEWAALRAAGGIVLNYYGPGAIAIPTANGQRLSLVQRTRYPAEGNIEITLGMAKPEAFVLYLRIPAWSAKTGVKVNGASAAASPGAYLRVEREWKSGDTISLQFDMSPHYWMGEREVDGKASVYFGPLLLAFDPTYNSVTPDEIPEFDARQLALKPARAEGEYAPLVLFEASAANGTTLRLCDFATAGVYGNVYRTWLPMRNLQPRPFDRQRPVWANRP